MREYLRRSAVYADAYGRAEGWPFLDLASVVFSNAPSAPLPADLAGLPLRMRQVIAGMLRWAACLDRGLTPDDTRPALPDPYEPLLIFFERGGGFTVESQMIDVDSAALPIRDADAYRRLEPWTIPSVEELDALDGPSPAPSGALAPRSASGEDRPAPPAAAHGLLVTVDCDKCIGNGVCAEDAPATFRAHPEGPRVVRIGDVEYTAGCAEVLRDSTDGRETILNAALMCPSEAITVRDAQTGEQLAP